MILDLWDVLQQSGGHTKKKSASSMAQEGDRKVNSNEAKKKKCFIYDTGAETYEIGGETLQEVEETLHSSGATQYLFRDEVPWPTQKSFEQGEE